MPSSSAKQHRFMEAIAHNKAFAKKVGVPQSVGQDFANADKGKSFKESKMATKKMATGGITKAKMSKVKAGGMRPHGEHSIQEKGHTKAMMPTMKGSTPLGMKKGGKTK
jgi:hypothetical protein